MAQLMFLVMYPLSEYIFYWARGANARGRTKGKEKSSLKLGSPLSLRFSPSRSLFPYPLLSQGISHSQIILLSIKKCRQINAFTLI